MERTQTQTQPLSLIHVNKSLVFTNRLHILLHFTALCFLVYYRLCFIFQDPQTRRGSGTPLFPWLLVFASEIILSFIWILNQAFHWHPISRTVFPERLPQDDKLPPIDVFICTADPTKEPTLDVMNTLLSAMALDYPPEKLHVYVSDDGGSPVTLKAMREALKFARWWLPFCMRYRIEGRCPKAYFSASENDGGGDFDGGIEFLADKKMIKEKYEAFKQDIERVKEDQDNSGDTTGVMGHNHPPIIEVIQVSKLVSTRREDPKQMGAQARTPAAPRLALARRATLAQREAQARDPAQRGGGGDACSDPARIEAQTRRPATR